MCPRAPHGGVLYCYQQDINKVADLVQVIREVGLTVQSDILWYYAPGRPQGKCFRKEHEFILYCSKGEPAVFNTDAVRIPYESRDKRHNPKGKSLGTVWRAPRIMPNYGNYTGHPTQKPTLLSDRMILASSNVGDTVLVPFAGSGSEVESAVCLGRNFLACEINGEYIKQCILPRIRRYRMPTVVENAFTDENASNTLKELAPRLVGRESKARKEALDTLSAYRKDNKLIR